MKRLKKIRRYTKKYLNKNIIKKKIIRQSKGQSENILVKYKKQRGY